MRCERYARELDGLRGTDRDPRSEDWENAARRAAARASAAPFDRPRSTFAASRGRKCRAAGGQTVAPGVVVEQRVIPLHRVGLLRSRRALSAAVLAPDDGHSGAGGRAWARSSPSARGRIPPCSRPRSRPASIGCFRSAARTRLRALAYGTRIDPARGQDRRTGQQVGGGREGAREPRLRHRLLRRSDRDSDRRQPRAARAGLPPI